VPGGPVARAALYAVGLALGLWLFGRLWPLLWALLWPFAAGGALALLVERPVQWLVARGAARGLAGALCLAAALGGSALLAAWLARTTWVELWRLRGRLPALYAAAAAALQRLAGGRGAPLPPDLRTALAAEAARGFQTAGPLVQHLLLRLQQAVAGIPDAFFAVLLTFATAYFLCRDRPLLAAWLRRILPEAGARRLQDVLGALRHSVWGLWRAQLLLALGTFTVSLGGLWLIGAPYALLASLAAAVLDFLPVVGPGLVYLPWILGAALSHQPGAALALAAVFGVLVLLRVLLAPHLLGRQVGLHPFLALASMYVGARLAGVEGLVLGPLAAALAQALSTPAPPRAPRPPAAAP